MSPPAKKPIPFIFLSMVLKLKISTYKMKPAPFDIFQSHLFGNKIARQFRV